MSVGCSKSRTWRGRWQVLWPHWRGPPRLLQENRPLGWFRRHSHARMWACRWKTFSGTQSWPTVLPRKQNVSHGCTFSLFAGSLKSFLSLDRGALKWTDANSLCRKCNWVHTKGDECVEVATGSKVSVLHLGEETHACPGYQQNNVVLDLDWSFSKPLLRHPARQDNSTIRAHHNII